MLGSICAYVKKAVKAISGICNASNAGVSEKGRLIYEIRRDVVCLTQMELEKCSANSVDLCVRSFFDQYVNKRDFCIATMQCCPTFFSLQASSS